MIWERYDESMIDGCWGGRLLEVFSWSGEIGVAERLSDFYHY